MKKMNILELSDIKGPHFLCMVSIQPAYFVKYVWHNHLSWSMMGEVSLET